MTARAVWLGRRRYAPVLELQKQLQRARKDQEVGDTILLVEHEPVITLGKGADAENILLSEAMLSARGVDRAAIGRGGDVTYHGPGQLVIYPILDLRPDRCDVRRYVRSLCEVMVLIARDHGVESGVVDGMVGVWVDREAPEQWGGAPWAGELAKIGAIGVRISRWVTMHGLALNVTTDLDAFSMIVPCGISEHGVASLASLGGNPGAVSEIALASRDWLRQGLDWDVAPIEDFAEADAEALAAIAGS